MASDAAADAELLDAELLLQDTGGMVETHESEPTGRTEELAGVMTSGQDMSAEDVLRQLDSVTLSLDGGTGDAVENLGDSEPISELLTCSQNATRDEETVAPVVSAVEEDEDEEVMVDALEEAPAVEVVEVRPENSSDPQVRLSSTETNDAESAPLVAHMIGQTEESASAEADDLLSSGRVSTEAEEAAAPDQGEIPCAANGEEMPNSSATVAAMSDETEWEASADPPLETQHGDAQAPDDGDQVMPEGLSNESDGDLTAVDSTSPPREDSVLTEQTVLMEQPVLMEQSGAEGEGEYQSQQPSGDGSGEPIVPRPELNVGDGVEYLVSPPPAPMATLPQPTFSGSLNPANASGQDAGDDNDGDDDDDDSDSEYEDEAVVPPPLSLEATSDNEEELEVDTVVAEEIRAIKRNDVAVTETDSEGQKSIVSNPLLMALATGEQDHAAKMTLPADSRSKPDDIAFGVADPLEVRAAQVPVVHPESSAVAFGIGYQSLRKRPDREGCDDAYSIAKGPTFQDLESEVTLSSDASLAQRRSDALAVEPAEDADEFGAIPDGVEGDAGAVSPTRVETILQATRASLAMRSAAAEEAVLVEELKRATVHEKRHLRETPPPEKTKPTENDGALTVKELHSIYKRGLGDHEVRLLDDGEVATVPSAGETTHRGPHELTTPAIAEENEEEEEEAHDADAVRVTSERTATFADHSVNSMRDDDSNEWKEIHLQPHLQLAPPLPSVSSARHADANACSRITYAEALRHFLESDAVLAHRDSIVAEEKPPSASCFSCFSRPRLAFGGAIEQRDRFFCVAATQFDPRNAVHVGMLQTIYRKLLPTGSHADVALMGPHWETIGFQGSDPSTDLRGCGVLSLLQMLHFVETHAEVARRFHAASQHPTRHFPLACALINVTLQCVVTLRSGALYKESNKRGSVFDAANALHAAIATQLMKEIQVTSEDIPLVMKRVLDNGRLYPDRAIETHALESSDAQPPSPRKASAMAASRAPSSHAAAGEFTEIGLHSVDDD